MSTPRRKVNAGQDADRPLVLDSYGRLSRVPETGELEKVETQWADNRKVIERVGAVLGEELKDGLSAWKRTVRRPGWEALLERVESGASDGIVVWHTDRLFRQPRDLEKLIELGERGFKVFSAHGERDLADSDDRYMLRIEVAHAARSSDDTSRRIRRRFATYREQGKSTGGPRRFGFPGGDMTWKPAKGQTKADRPQVLAELVARERQAIKDAAEGWLTGLNWTQLAGMWNDAGVPTTYGGPWVPVAVRDTMKRPALGGVIAYEGVPVGTLNGEPILDQRTYERLQAKFAGQKPGRTFGRTCIGTGLLRCGLCGTKLSGKPNSGQFYKDGTQRASYYCSTTNRRGGCGKVYADMRQVNIELKVFVVSRLSDPRHAAAVSAARSKTSERLAAVTAEIEECEALQRALSERLGSRKIKLASFDEANEPLVADLAKLYAERESLSGSTPDGPTKVQSVESLQEQWDNGGVADKRSMLTDALGRDRLVIDPYNGLFRNGKKAFDKARIHLADPKDNPEPGNVVPDGR